MRSRSLFLVLIAAATQASAQYLPLLDPARVRLLSQEISGDAAYKHIRFLSQLHRPRGTEKLWEAATYVEAQAKAAGLTRVSTIKQAFTQPPWNTHIADLWIVGDRPERIASTLQNDVHVAEHSRPTNVTTELIDIGGGTEAELKDKDVRGKIVVTFGAIGTVMRDVVLGRGAAGVIAYPDPGAPPNGIVGAGLGRPDQVPWLQLSRGPVDGRDPTFGFSLSLRQGLALARRIKTSPTPLKAHAVVEADSGRGDRTTPWQVLVEAYLPGTDPTAGQEIVLTAHLQEEQHSANDDGSGVANLLEIGRALTRLIADGRLPRPTRSIRFWWTTEIHGERQYFADHPEASRSMWVAINQDMAGAEQSIDLGRKQDITRLPASRFHFFNDVAESVTEYLVAANTIYLAAIRNGTDFYPEPHFAHTGSQHRYAAEMVWYHEDSDHETFNEPPIDVPALSFTNMPDRFIHSSEDDLWNIDATQLGRNALSAALMAYIMASADADAAPKLAAHAVRRQPARRRARPRRPTPTPLPAAPIARGSGCSPRDRTARSESRPRSTRAGSGDPRQETEARGPARPTPARSSGRAFEEPVDSSEKFGGRERLSDIVVNADLKAPDHILGATQRRQHQDRSFGVLGQRPDLLNQAKPVEPGHLHVDDEEIVRATPRRLESLNPVGPVIDAVTGPFEPVLDERQRESVILRDEDMDLTIRRRGHGNRGRRRGWGLRNG